MIRLQNLIIFFVCLFIFPIIVVAQLPSKTLEGKIILVTKQGNTFTDATEVIAKGAAVQWIDGSNIAFTNPFGEFAIAYNDATVKQLVVSYKGFTKDTITIVDSALYVTIKLNKATASKGTIIGGIRVTATRPNTEVSFISTAQQLKIGKGELAKAACCNLSESFETTPSVDVSYADAVTGQKQIQLLGLATPYTLFTQENMPSMRGLASISALNFTPGTWVNSMQLSKGSGSVANGYDGLAGQINIELAKPNEQDKVVANVYQNSNGRTEANLNLMHEPNKQVAQGILLHYKNQVYKQDMNMDMFMDNPLGQQAIALYRAQYFAHNGFELQGGAKYTYAQLQGGSLHTNHNNWRYTDTTNRTEAWLKIGKVNPKKQWQSIGFQISGVLHKQNVQVPNKKYNGQQQQLYSNLIYQSNFKNTNHSYRTGASFIMDRYKESFPDTVVVSGNRTEIVPGIFAEHTYAYLDKFTIVSGLRADFHNIIGAFITPRVHIRYVPFGKHTLRASIGKATRTASVLTENMGAYYSNRTFKFDGDKRHWQNGNLPEVAWNMGASWIAPFMYNFKKGTLMLDYYYSTFSKQIIVDYETPREVHFYQLQGNSSAKSFQAQVDYTLIRKKLEARVAYRWYNIQTTMRNTILSKPLISTHRAFGNIAYTTSKQYSYDATVVWNGAKRLPNAFATATDSMFVNGNSPSFVTINAHVRKVFNKQHQVYIGAENLTNYMQPNAIISASNPFSNNFDAGQVWGPVSGINVYIGYTFTVIEKERH